MISVGETLWIPWNSVNQRLHEQKNRIRLSVGVVKGFTWNILGEMLDLLLGGREDECLEPC